MIVSTGKPQVCGCENQLVVDDTGFTAKSLENVKVTRFIYVPNKIVNLVTE